MKSTVATVVDGKVTALAAGTTEISATAGSKTEKFTLTVEEAGPVEPEDIFLTHSKDTMKIGETDQLAVDIDPSDASQEFEWEFDVEGIVSIDENNLLTALKGGTVNITVSCKENPELTDTYQLSLISTEEF